MYELTKVKLSLEKVNVDMKMLCDFFYRSESFYETVSHNNVRLMHQHNCINMSSIKTTSTEKPEDGEWPPELRPIQRTVES